MTTTEKLKFTIRINSINDSIITIYAESKTKKFKIEETLFYFARQRLRKNMIKIQKRFDDIYDFLEDIDG